MLGLQVIDRLSDLNLQGGVIGISAALLRQVRMTGLSETQSVCL